MEHSISCRQERQESEKRRQDWIKKWPNHCKKCEGRGIEECSQSHPYGSTTATETWNEPCDECVEYGKCPRCGKTFSEEYTESFLADSLPCTHCGWCWETDQDDACPSIWECWGDCVYEEEGREQRKNRDWNIK